MYNMKEYFSFHVFVVCLKLREDIKSVLNNFTLLERLQVNIFQNFALQILGVFRVAIGARVHHLRSADEAWRKLLSRFTLFAFFNQDI